MPVPTAVTLRAPSGQRAYGGGYPAGYGSLGGTVAGDEGTLSGTLGTNAPPPPSSGDLPANSVQLGTTAATVVTYMQAFKQGALSPADALAGRQRDIKNLWPDGSVKLALVSRQVSGSTSYADTLTIGTAAAGATLTLADLKAALTQPVSIGCGAYGTATWSGTDFDSPAQVVAAGPLMSSWVYRKPVGSDAHLVAWIEVRLFQGGAVEVLPWIENGYLLVASPSARAATFTFSLGGTTRYSGALTLEHHQRTVLLDGTKLSHWLGTDPGITVRHDRAYLMGTKLVPNYSAVVPNTDPGLTAQPSSFTPLTRSVILYSSDFMPDTGYQRPIGMLPEHDVLHLVSTGARTYETVIRGGYEAGRYAIHYRDETTNRVPRFSSYPNLCLAQSSSGIKDVGSSTLNQYCPSVTVSGTIPIWDPAHCPSVGFMAYLLTGRWYFMEECQFAATLHYFWNTDSPSRRNGSDGLLLPVAGGVQTRSTAWTWRALLHAFIVTPDSDSTLRAELKASLEANFIAAATRYTDSYNALGLMDDTASHGGGVRKIAAWMNDFVAAVTGYAKSNNLGLSATATTALDTFYAWVVKGTVGRFNTKSSGAWYVNGAPYWWVAGPDDSVSTWYSTMAQCATQVAIYYAADAGFSTSEGVMGSVSGSSLPSGTQYLSNAMPALSYAVEHGVAGAADALQRINDSINWKDSAALWNSADPAAPSKSPSWSVQPRVVMPSWMAGKAVNEWFAIPGTQPAGSAAFPDQAADYPYGNATRFFSDFCGLAFRRSRSALMGGAHGGHSGGTANRFVHIALNSNSPVWVLDRADASPALLDPNIVNGDGSPCCVHTYWTEFWVDNQTRYRRFGTKNLNGGAGGTATPNACFGFDLSTGTWDAYTTWANLPSAAGGFGACQDPATGDVYIGYATSLVRYTPDNDTFTTVYTGGSNSLFPPLAWDTKRRQVFSLAWGDGLAFSTGATAAVFSSGGTVRTAITINASAAYTAWQTAAARGYCAMVYDEANDRFLFYVGSYPTGTQTIYVITPNAGTSWDMSLLTTTGVTPPEVGGDGIMSRFVYVPALKGCVLAAKGWANLHFIRTA